MPHSAPKHRCEEHARLAVVDRAESAQRDLAAAGSLTDPGSGERLHPIAVSTVSRTRVTALAVERARAEAASAGGSQAAALRARAARLEVEVRSQNLHDVADELNAIPIIERAL
ncbi:MAG: hypothetical protein H7146_10430 [Burkholderiaceae bacterium]|nr:hypothetical protein [Microbacteriaceae bacterium]